MKKVLIVSLNFNPGHVSHMVASYKQCVELGYLPVYYVVERFVFFLPKNSRICVYEREAVPQTDVAMLVFPSQKNLLLIRHLRKHGAKIIYFFHEPLAPMKEYRKAGFSYRYLMKLWVINKINSITVKWSNIIILPSQKAFDFYKENSLYKNNNCHCIPLLYDDERTDEHTNKERKYFAYIGTVAADHSFGEYLNFVTWAVREKRLPHVQFLIATKSEFEVPYLLSISPRVVIQKGMPMTDSEINDFYASSIAVWNAYARTTQSGVMAKSFMFGTPTILLRKNLSEFTEDGRDVVAIDDNTSFTEIEAAVLRITNSFSGFSTASRMIFENMFFYRNYNSSFQELLSSL